MDICHCIYVQASGSLQMNVHGWKCKDESARMNVWGWKCKDESARMKVRGWKFEDESARMKVWGWKCGNENAGDEKSGDEKARGWKTGDESEKMKCLGMKWYSAPNLEYIEKLWYKATHCLNIFVLLYSWFPIQQNFVENAKAVQQLERALFLVHYNMCLE